jgi:hypothetical protein
MMENKAKTRCRGTNGNLAPALLTQGYKGADCYALIANTQAFVSQEGFILWDEDAQRAVFVQETEEPSDV